ncbi:hypothetical protein J7384_13305 [Endozoicomonas sp. G2_1]|uniref:hypothetical protein n=1 Tax=Endozoicomonas sp. G2_1 TaxID=2821091 RepID=UPI001ADAAE6B|nr:hypothetical protein [Endozoicomonas sp. G2_1]MBO9491341.1 hypothetical protein [Endozoicomonas sp. G2_1]
MVKNFNLLLILSTLFVSGAQANQSDADSEQQRLIEKRKRVLAAVIKEREGQPHFREITAQPLELTDKTGLVYLGLSISRADLAPFLHQLRAQLSDRFDRFRNNQIKRDGNNFHLTLVNPFEYQTIDKQKLNLNQKIKVSLHGLGNASNDKSTAYYVVASTAQGQFIRQQLLLKSKDFHVTLGFEPSDVYDKPKGLETLIK